MDGTVWWGCKIKYNIGVKLLKLSLVLISKNDSTKMKQATFYNLNVTAVTNRNDKTGINTTKCPRPHFRRKMILQLC